jgi:hypothetical protein
MSNTLSPFMPNLPPAGWAPPRPENGAGSRATGGTLSVSSSIEAGASEDVDAWTSAVVSPLLEESASY